MTLSIQFGGVMEHNPMTMYIIADRLAYQLKMTSGPQSSRLNASTGYPYIISHRNRQMNGITEPTR